MPRETSIHAITSVQSMIIVIGAVVIVVLVVVAIAAWLVRDIAEKAINKTTPDRVAPVVLALAALLDPLHRFLPWSSASSRVSRLYDLDDSARGSADNRSVQTPREGSHHG